MLNKIIGFSVNNKLIIGLFTVILVVFGLYETTKLSIDAVPDITDNQIQIITTAPSLGATDIERLVTFPIEQANSNIAGIEEIRSFSRFGLSVVTIVFNENTDVYWARQQVAERLQVLQNEIPAEIGVPEMGPISTGLGEIYQYVVRAKKGYEDKYDITELRTIQDWIVRRQLMGVKGVAEVSSFGGKLKQFEIAINADRLQSFNLTLIDVFDALEKNNQNTGGAYIEKGPTALYIRSEGLVSNVKDLEEIAVKISSDGSPVLLRDVAEVKIGYATRYGAMTYNDEGEVAGAVVMMLKGGNSSEVIKNVKERVASIQQNLPEGVIIEPFLDRTKMVNNAIHTIEKNLAEGALIVIFVLVLFLGNLRAGLLVASVIPLSMLFAIILMNVFGVSGNLMSLGALDFGLIVDGAVIIVEAVLHQLHFSKKYANTNVITQKEMNKQVGFSAGKMVNSAVFGQIIILIVYLPIFTLRGIEGKMFIPMAQTVSFALIGAFILSLTYIPMMSSLVLSKKITHKANFSEKLMAKLEVFHQRILKKALKYPKILIGSVLVVFILSLAVLSRLGGEFIPALEEGDFAVEARVLTGSNLNTTVEYVNKASHILKSKFPEVEKVVAKIGSGEVPTDPMPMEAADMMVILKDKKEWTSAGSFPELAEKMNNSLKSIPGLSTGFQYPVQMRFNELMTGARQDVVCKIFGEDIEQLAKYAQQLGGIVKTVEGAEDLYVEKVTGLPQVLIKYNRSNIAKYGLNIASINRVVNTAFAGQAVGQIYEGERHFDIVLRLEKKQRKSIEDIRDLLIPTPKGVQVPLYELADISIKEAPIQIQREDAKRRIIVGFNVRGRDVQSIVNELQSKIEQKMTFAPGYYVTYGGAFENLNKAKERLMIAVPISLALIFLLLFFAFRSVKESLLIYSAIPLSAIGGIFFLALRGMPFSISAGIGFIALFGVAVLNGIVLIAEYNRLIREGMTDVYQVVIEGTKTRLRPVLMTAAVASLGFLPMALSHGVGAEVQRPLATVVIGGLLLATLLTLFVLPCLFILFDKIKLPKMIKFKHNKLTVTLILLFASLSSFSQSITLKDALNIAETNSFVAKNTNLISEYYAKKKSNYIPLSTTTISGEYGKMNSGTIDNKIGISQTFNLPTAYAKEKKVLEQEWHNAVGNNKLNLLELKKAVTELFYNILVQQARLVYLNKFHQQYEIFLEKTDLKFKKGETNILETANAIVKHEQDEALLSNLKNEIEVSKIRFGLLLNSDSSFHLKADSIVYLLSNTDINVAEFSHPELQLAKNEIDLAKANYQLEQQKLMPEFSLGYSSQSFRDIDNKRYGVFEFGVGLPIFTNGQRKQVKAEKYKIDIAKNQFSQKQNQWKAELISTKLSYQNLHQQLQNYQSKQLPIAHQIFKISMEQFEKGEIDYLDWISLNTQATEITQNYFDLVAQFNVNAIYLQYLLSK